MKIRFKPTVLTTILCLLIASCTRASTTHVPVPSVTLSPTRHTSTLVVPSKTSNPTLEQATATVPNKLCEDTKETVGVYASPDEQWIAAVCYWSNEEDEASYLQIVGVDSGKEWKIYFRDYQDLYGRKDIVFPVHWSKDSRFLYAAASSRLSGCCWVGARYVLLVRVDLESGEQITIINVPSPDQGYPVSIKFTESGRHLLFTPSTPQSYDFTVLDLTNWNSEFVTLELEGDIDLYYAVISPDESKMVFPLYVLKEWDFYIDSIGMIDFASGEQKILLSGLNEEKIIYPVRWVDGENILVSNTDPNYLDVEYFQNTAEYWLLNIYSGVLEKKDVP